jgi:hypothetical protein
MEGLQIPVYHSEDGRLSSLLSFVDSAFSLSGSDSEHTMHTGSLTRSICNQIFTKPLHWPKATDLPEGTTHTVDFGAGGISDIGPLTVGNLDGRGV